MEERTQPMDEIKSSSSLSLDAFVIKKLIGKGGFAEVYLAIEKQTQNLVAIKCIAKTRILRPGNENGKEEFFVGKASTQNEKERQRVAAVLLERNILCFIAANSPFLIGAKACFQSATHLFIVMPYLSGGDLHRYLDVVGVMNEELCRFCVVEIILALESLHKENIIYRDLKPGNLLFDENGHLHLCDYGLCKKLNATDSFLTTGRAGTRGFRAPEVIRKEAYGFSCDFFSLGVSMYQFMTGQKMFGKSDLLHHILRIPQSSKKINMIAKNLTLVSISLRNSNHYLLTLIGNLRCQSNFLALHQKSLITLQFFLHQLCKVLPLLHHSQRSRKHHSWFLAPHLFSLLLVAILPLRKLMKAVHLKPEKKFLRFAPII